MCTRPAGDVRERTTSASRREFLKRSAAVAGGVSAALSVPRSAHAAGSDVIRLGLVGCGGRGTGAARQALSADPGARLVAVSDAFGVVCALHAARYGGGVWVRAREPGMTDMQYQMRNWYYFTWLSGDFNVEQFVHQLDRMAWVMKDEYPLRCYSTGGRQARTGPDHGHRRFKPALAIPF